MLQSFYLRDRHQSTHHVIVENFAIRREHGSKLEREHLSESPTYFAIDSNFLAGLLTPEAHGLKDDRHTAVSNDLIHLPAVERNNITVETFDISTGDEAVTRTKDFARPTQY